MSSFEHNKTSCLSLSTCGAKPLRFKNAPSRRWCGAVETAPQLMKTLRAEFYKHLRGFQILRSGFVGRASLPPVTVKSARGTTPLR